MRAIIVLSSKLQEVRRILDGWLTTLKLSPPARPAVHSGRFVACTEVVPNRGEDVIQADRRGTWRTNAVVGNCTGPAPEALSVEIASSRADATRCGGRAATAILNEREMTR